MLKSSKDTE